MDQNTIISEWEKRAKMAGVPIGKVCEHAGIAPSSFSRWKGGGSLLIATASRIDASLRHFEESGVAAPESAAA